MLSCAINAITFLQVVVEEFLLRQTSERDKLDAVEPARRGEAGEDICLLCEWGNIDTPPPPAHTASLLLLLLLSCQPFVFVRVSIFATQFHCPTGCRILRATVRILANAARGTRKRETRRENCSHWFSFAATMPNTHTHSGASVVGDGSGDADDHHCLSFLLGGNFKFSGSAL